MLSVNDDTYHTDMLPIQFRRTTSAIDTESGGPHSLNVPNASQVGFLYHVTALCAKVFTF